MLDIHVLRALLTPRAVSSRVREKVKETENLYSTTCLIQAVKNGSNLEGKVVE